MESINFEDWQEAVLNGKQPVVVDFWHDLCKWCRRLEPELDEVAKEFGAKVRFVKLNILSSARNTLLAHKYGVMSTPSLILFCHGRPVEELVGYRPKEVLKKELSDLVGRSDECSSSSTPFEPK